MANQFRKIIGCNIRLQPDYPQTAKLVIPSEALGVSGCIRRPRVPRRAWGEVRGRGGMSASDPSNREKLPRAQAILATLGELSTTCARARGGDSRSLTSSPIVASVSGHCTSISGSSWRFPRWNTGGGTAWPQLGRFFLRPRRTPPSRKWPRVLGSVILEGFHSNIVVVLTKHPPRRFNATVSHKGSGPLRRAGTGRTHPAQSGLRHASGESGLR
jgi:hypothetical protein